jgi:hypothetical protein
LFYFDDDCPYYDFDLDLSNWELSNDNIARGENENSAEGWLFPLLLFLIVFFIRNADYSSILSTRFRADFLAVIMEIQRQGSQFFINRELR